MPPGTVQIFQQTRCPSCGFYMPAGEEVPVANGDRILVLKCVYQFVDPKRWDVVVFKNPHQPHGELHQAADRSARRHHRDHRRRHLHQWADCPQAPGRPEGALDAGL